jgi:hypothetical protein
MTRVALRFTQATDYGLLARCASFLDRPFDGLPHRGIPPYEARPDPPGGLLPRRILRSPFAHVAMGFIYCNLSIGSASAQEVFIPFRHSKIGVRQFLASKTTNGRKPPIAFDTCKQFMAP